MAPEISRNLPYDGKKVDIFSAGVLFFTMKAGVIPFIEAKRYDR